MPIPKRVLWAAILAGFSLSAAAPVEAKSTC